MADMGCTTANSLGHSVSNCLSCPSLPYISSYMDRESDRDRREYVNICVCIYIDPPVTSL
jgi:hypothetical protein